MYHRGACAKLCIRKVGVYSMTYNNKFYMFICASEIGYAYCILYCIGSSLLLFASVRYGVLFAPSLPAL